MSAIANFKKRRAADKAKQASRKQFAETVAKTGINLVNTLTGLAEEAKEVKALTLLAKLLGCEESEAIEKAHIAVEQKARFVEMHVDLAAGEDKSVMAEVTTDSEGQITDISEINTELSDSADSVNAAAENVELATDNVNQAAETIDTAASDVSEASSDLAYSADDIANVTADLKEATTELKKPSAAPKSSPGAKNDKAKSNSNKSA
ncbi:hypothetical protein CXF86_11005 [Shewanella sp. GutCb]|uniref:hypothetical protein n=1 Tax=Shewanella sp. GutCb TaxID=2058315 RepID=UPI000C7AD85D|nr:hypothetical protein [Shewanella sp. GutCb]PKG74811.1 hypothetical protein CXF86_11005 [Shewanella sp. GutCb]